MTIDGPRRHIDFRCTAIPGKDVEVRSVTCTNNEIASSKRTIGEAEPRLPMTIGLIQSTWITSIYGRFSQSRTACAANPAEVGKVEKFGLTVSSTATTTLLSLGFQRLQSDL